MKFGTSGLRGLVTDLEGHAAARYTTAFAKHLLRARLAKLGDSVFVGGDYRPSTASIAGTCIGALARAGFVPVDCGSVPTPALSFYAMSKAAASLMVTGSHIPSDRNGIKFYRPDGEIDKADEQAITQIADELRYAPMDVARGSVTSETEKARALFILRNKALLPTGALSGLKIGVYQHSTVARDWLVEVIAGYGADVVALGRSEEFIPVDTEAVSKGTISLMQNWVGEHRLDAIVSADGDGDRPLVADEKGSPLRGDLLGLIAAQFLGAEVVVTPVTSNSGIEASGAYEVVRTKVGSPFVIEGMNRALAADKVRVIGFEANGGVLTASDIPVSGTTLNALPTRDSFLPVLAALSLIKHKAQPLSKVAAAFRMPAAAADRLENFSTESSRALMAHLQGATDNLSAFFAPLGSIASVSDMDGLRVTLADRRIIHLRPSGNAPEMRCYVEAEDEASAQSLLKQSLYLVRQWALRTSTMCPPLDS